MIRQIAPQFFTTDLPATLSYYKDKLGFDCVGTWQDPPVYAIVARDQHRIHFRCAEPPVPNPDKYDDELLDAYLFIDDAEALYAEYASRGVEFTRALSNTPWGTREFVVKDCDGRLLAFGANPPVNHQCSRARHAQDVSYNSESWTTCEMADDSRCQFADSVASCFLPRRVNA
jgi:uncharacterized glyoxalase superfamily protein PhnB